MIEELLKWAETQTSKITADEEIAHIDHNVIVDVTQASSVIYSVISHLLGDEMRNKKLAAGRQRGLELWRSLYADYEGNSDVVRLAKLSRFITPQRCKDLAELSAALDKLEVLGAEVASDQPDSSKTVALTAMLPMELADRVTDDSSLTTYKARMSFVRSHMANKRDGALAKGVAVKAKAGRNDMDVDLLQALSAAMSNSEDNSFAAECTQSEEWNSQDAAESAQPSMNDALWAFVSSYKGKGKSKGKGKEKGKFQGECWNCGKTGHRSAECWSAASQPKGDPKGKGKGKGKRKGESELHSLDSQQCTEDYWNLSLLTEAPSKYEVKPPDLTLPAGDAAASSR